MNKTLDPSKDRVYLSVIIPVYNEEQRIAVSLKHILQFLKAQRYASEVLIVDDGSSDHTVEVVNSITHGANQVRILQHGKNLGKGGAVRTGMLEARGKYVFFTDADLSVPFDSIDPFLAKLEAGFDLAIGTRGKNREIVEVRQPIYREAMGKVYTTLTNWILSLNVSDFTCGWKGFCREVALELFRRQNLTGWSFDAEILFLAKRKEYRLIEIPVRWRNDAATKVRLWKDVIGSFFGLLQVRYYEFQGRYK